MTVRDLPAVRSSQDLGGARRRQRRRPGWWRRVVLMHGWRAYAVPVLAVLTVVALTTSFGAARPSARPVAAGGDSWPAVGGAIPAGDQGFLAATPEKSQAPILLRTETDSTGCQRNDAVRHVFVSIEQQRAWMCDAHRQVYSSPVTTGAAVDNDQTPKGTWYVQGRQRDRYLIGPGYRDYVHWWVPFNGDFGFHDAPWQTMAYGSPDYTTDGSHGCVHLPKQAMQWFYSWAVPGEVEVTIT